MLDGIRKSGKWIIIAFLLFMLAIFLMGIALSGIELLGAAAQGNVGSVLILLVVVAVMVGFLWLIFSILRRSPRDADDLERLRKARPFAKDGGEAPGTVKRDPWLG